MNERTLKATLTQCRHGEPLVAVEALTPSLSLSAEVRPADLRALADALLKVAADAEGRKIMHRGRPLPDTRKVYALG